MSKTALKKKDTTVGKHSKKNSKIPINKQSVLIKKKKSDEKVKLVTISNEVINKSDINDTVMIEENVPENSVKSVDQLTNLDEQLKSFFTKIQSLLTQFKIDQENEKSKIMFFLSQLENKMSINEKKIDKLMFNFENLSKKNDPVENVTMKNKSNIALKNKQELQQNIDDIKMCIDYLINPNAIYMQQTQQYITANTSIYKGTNTNRTCNSKRCVCQLINSTNAANSLKGINSYDSINRIKYEASFENSKQSEHQQTVHVNQF